MVDIHQELTAAQIIAGEKAHIVQTYKRGPMVLSHGQGMFVWDTEGHEYLDFMAGIAVDALGHSDPGIVAVLTEQANKLWHLSNMFPITGQERLAQRYVDLTFADYAFFCNSGAEAIEGCIKIARRYHWSKGQPERIGVLSFTGSFHGRTLGGINAGAQEKYREGFGPRLPGFRSIEFGDAEGNSWTTIGVSPNIIDASFQALTDSITYKLLQSGARVDA